MCTPASRPPLEIQISCKYAFWNFQGPKISKCVLPPPPRLSETQIAWEYAFWDFQGPKIPKCVLPPPPRLSETQIAWEYAFWDFPVPKILKCVLTPAPFRAPDCLAARILWLSRVLPPRLPGSTHFVTFKGTPTKIAWQHARVYALVLLLQKQPSLQPHLKVVGIKINLVIVRTKPVAARQNLSWYQHPIPCKHDSPCLPAD